MATTRRDQIEAAFDDLRTARIELYEIGEEELAAKAALKVREFSLLLSGAIIGKNAETREAQLKEGCKEELAATEATRAKRQRIQLQFDLATMRVQELQWQIRNDQAMIAKEP